MYPWGSLSVTAEFFTHTKTLSFCSFSLLLSLFFSFLLSLPLFLPLLLSPSFFLSLSLSLLLSLDYDAIFQHLEAVRGSVEIRRGFVRDVMKEAGKFKRKQLIQQLEEWGAKLTPLKPVGGTHGGHTHNKTKIAPQRR